ncbi:Helix-turn-helix domain-containing protein [Salegentibacter agarivorans]|uniref:Helix-turn-helix domain-containing protein n=1 Tax=Salegentibacter agarivorans TaxID=345907 RepID=A0A1I2KP48_9FLAO|nr:AraC family transcriptional regulator [Salegentibacter agarivorans]SFF68782.1 Helix-turn-helix domain-containing protein [Salegentibacter agarivorans]
MYYPNDKLFDQITHLITALANDEYDKRIKVNKLRSKLSTIGVLLNMLAGVLKLKVPSKIPEYDLSYLNHIILMVEENYQIKDYNTGSNGLFDKNQLHNLESILDEESLNKVQGIINSTSFDQSVKLNYRLNDDLFLTMDSRITKFENNNSDVFILSAVKTISKNEWTKEKLLKKAQHPKRQFDISKNKKIIDRLYHYLMDNLDSPLKPIPEIARDLETNSTVLIRGFKAIHGKTIASFHREKRLEKARDLVLDTDTKLSNIATLCGFGSLSHFSRAFKKHFGVNPSDSR